MNYSIIQGHENIKVTDAQHLLKMTYWADKRSYEQIEQSMRNSVCYGVTVDGTLVGFEVLNDRTMVRGLNC